MTGCAAAIASRDRYTAIAARCPPLAYRLHEFSGLPCRRLVPLGVRSRQCADCVADVVLPARCETTKQQEN